jgi:hypothetical protein
VIEELDGGAALLEILDEESRGGLRGEEQEQ